MDNFKQAALAEIDKIHIYEDRISISDYKRARVFLLLIELNTLAREDLSERMEKVVMREGEANLNHLKAIRGYTPYPNDILSPHSLAYALVHNQFSKRERRKIKFNRQTEAGFVEEYYIKNFPQLLVKQLLDDTEPDYSVK